MSKQIPAISVLLPVYNGAPYLTESIDSILSQTWQDFELIIINDGSRDESAEIIRSYRDPRIRYFEQENVGLAATLNRGIGLARGQFVARQDQDDISLPQRFARQAEYLMQHSACGMVGTWADIWREGAMTGRTLRHPAENALLQLELLFDNPFVHSSVMIRTTLLRETGGYAVGPQWQPPEDFELWSRMAFQGELANIPEPLLIYREVGGSMSRSTDPAFWERVVNICCRNIRQMLGNQADPELIRGAARLLLHLDDGETPPDAVQLAQLMNALGRIMQERYPGYERQIKRRLREYYHRMLSVRLKRGSSRPAADLYARLCMYLLVR